MVRVALTELRQGVRRLVDAPGFTVIALLSLALAIGANTAVFSVVRGVLLEPLPYPDASALTYVWMDNRNQGIPDDITSYPNFVDWKNQNTSFAGIAGYTTTLVQLTGAGDPQELVATLASEAFFDVLGVAPLIGHGFSDDQFVDGQDNTVVLGHGLWQRQFGGDTGALGRTVDLGSGPVTIVGVMPEGFAFPASAQVYLPLAPDPQTREARQAFWLPVIGRLKPGVSLAAARSDMQVIGERLAREYPGNEGFGVSVEPMLGYQVRDVASGLWLILGVVAGVLLIACANLANLMLVRAVTRRRALAVRAALGATRWALVRHQLAECVLLAVAGAAVGIVLALLALAGLQDLVQSLLPRTDNIALDRGVLLFTLVVTAATAFGFGVLPALWSSRVQGSEALREGGRGQAGGRLATLSRRALVIGQVAVAMSLLVGAGLALRSFWNLLEVNPGLELERAAYTPLVLPQGRYADQSQRVAFNRELLARLDATPGVDAASLTSSVRMDHIHSSSNFTIEGRVPAGDQAPQELPLDSVMPGYFRTLGVRIVAGRDFDARDTAESAPVAIVNQTFAERYFPDGNVLGQRFVYGAPAVGSDTDWITIVGVVEDSYRRGLDKPVRMESFLPYAQRATRRVELVMRSALPDAVLARAVREHAQALDPLLPVKPVQRVGALFEADAAPRRLSLLLLGCFALVAVVLAVVGVYGVIAYGVSQRTGEFGVRIALGAGPARLQRMVLRQGLLLVSAGVALGAIGALLAAQLAGALLFRVGSADPLSYLAAAVLFVAAAAAACLVPARRAARTSTTEALRYE